jgi:hypothetical protein
MMDRKRMQAGWQRAAKKLYAEHPQIYQRVVRLTPDELEQIGRNRRPTGNLVVGAGLGGIHFRRFVGAPDRAAASSEHTPAPAAAYEQAVLNSSFFPATWIFTS